jgi:acyl-CoA synthetase (AMP-forming)/AMP-acid ligase II
MVNINVLPLELASSYQPAPTDMEDVAFLQFTSGSTRTPRGVVVSYRNLVANFNMMSDTFGLYPEQTGILWLPIYHDLGLVSLLLGQHGGSSVTMMSPESFVVDPAKWLRVISVTDRPVASAAPVFAFDFCVERIAPEQIDELDLANWESLICGAEPIRHKAVERFAKFLAPAGFQRSTVHAGYGLAEATVLVSGQPGADVMLKVDRGDLERGKMRPIRDSGGGSEEAPASISVLMSCGETGGKSDILVVDPDSHRTLPDGTVGELWVYGAHVARAYWADAERSAEVFGAHRKDQPSLNGSARAYLRTGDLGAIWEGQLYVTGRLKDMIPIRGRNIYPHDVEHAVGNAHSSAIHGMSVAFSVLVDDEDALVILQGISSEDEQDFEGIAQAIRLAVIEHCEVEPHAVALLKPARIPRTTSGKIRRSRCRDLWLSAKLELLYGTAVSVDASAESTDPSRPPTRSDLRGIAAESRATVISTWLTVRVAQIGGLPLWRVETDKSLQGLGLDSVKIARLLAEIMQALDVQSNGEAFTIGELTSEIVRSIDAEEISPGQPGEGNVDAGSPSLETASEQRPSNLAERHDPFPLTDLQQAYMLGRSPTYEFGGIAAHAYLEFDIGDLDVERLGAGLRKLIERHEMLRAVVGSDGLQRIIPIEEVDWNDYGLIVTDIRSSSPEEVDARLAAVREAMSNEHLPLEVGPLLHVNAMLLPDGTAHLHIGIDLIIADMWSLQLLFAEWEAFYHDIAEL